jgi:hypothetical protein
MIELIHPPKPRAPPHEVHPEWQKWMDDSEYSREDARKELGLANGTFYRRIAKEPTLIDRLAMRSLYEGLEPFA